GILGTLLGLALVGGGGRGVRIGGLVAVLDLLSGVALEPLHFLGRVERPALDLRRAGHRGQRGVAPEPAQIGLSEVVAGRLEGGGSGRGGRSDNDGRRGAERGSEGENECASHGS